MQVFSGRVVGYRSKGCWFAPSLCSLVFRGHRASNVKLRILECFTLYLRGLRSIERNMRSFLRTVYVAVRAGTTTPFQLDSWPP
jgi:hypothetical protein